MRAEAVTRQQGRIPAERQAADNKAQLAQAAEQRSAAEQQTKVLAAQVERGKSDAFDAEARVAEARKQLDQITAQQTATEQQLSAAQQQVAQVRSEIVDAAKGSLPSSKPLSASLHPRR